MSSEVEKDGSLSEEGLDQAIDNRPCVETERLILQPFTLDDCETVQRIINDREIAANTRTIEYPYPAGAAEIWIRQHAQMWKSGEAAIFAIWIRQPAELVGAIGLEVSKENHHAELGYWLGRDWWGQGICTEAAKSIVGFGFEGLGLHKVHAHHLSRNPASGRVLEKVGMKKEGLLREHVRKWGVFEDVETYGVLAGEYKK